MVDPELFWEDGTPRSQRNAFTGFGYTVPHVDLRADDAAGRAGANSAATKRDRGQQLMPKLHLKGSKHRRQPEFEESLP